MTAAAGTAELDPRRWRALALVGTAFFMTILDVSIVNVALPSIGEDLQFSRENLQWVVTAYAITFGGFLLLGGRAADLLGRRRVFMVGLGIFTIASLFCGLADSEAWLIAARAVQGLGAAIISPAALSIVQTSFPEGPERNKALGIWGALGGSGAAAGVLFGGILTEYLGWEWIFFVNVPVGLLVLSLTVATIRESRVDDAQRTYDPLGAVTITASLMVLVYALSNAPEVGWSTFRTIGLLVLSGGLLVAFLAIEIRHRAPLVPLTFFRIRTVSAANGIAALLGASLFANFFVLTLYAQQVLGFSALKTGLTFLATAGTVVVVAGLAQALVTRVGPKPVMMTGFALFGGGLLYYTQISVDGSFVSDLLPGYLLVGFGLPFAFISVTIAALAGVSAAQAGLASGLLNTSQQIGGAIGVAVSSTIFTSRIGDLLAQGEPQPVALTEGFQAAFWVLAIVAGFGFLATLIFLRREDTIPELDDEAARAPVL